jgi:Flp pilus assembly protein CpaB
VTRSKLRNLALPLGLAAAAAILVGLYVISYRNSVTHGAGLVKVYVAARDIPAGTDGSSIAAGGYMKTQTVPHRAVVAGAITSAAPLTSLATRGQIYKGEQITLRQFAPIAQGGVFAKFSGKERLVVVPGDPFQLLAGTLNDGDRVDVVATTKYHNSKANARAAARVVLRNLLVLKAPEDSAAKTISSVTGQPSISVSLVMTDDQAQTMSWALKQADWFFALRPTNHPANSPARLETLYTFLAHGLPRSSAYTQIDGTDPEAIDAR